MRIFDAHFHIIDFNFPIIENQGYFPPNFVVEDYQNETPNLNVIGGAIVSGSFQGFDQEYLLKALKQLGSTFCGVTQLPFTVTDEEILNLNENGVKALRFNIKRGGSEEGLPYLLKLVDKGVHVKATGFGRVELDVENALKSIYEVNPDALMFGTDLPSTRAKRPFEYGDIKLIQQLFDEQATDKILYTNAFKWYFG
ncbi:amidohydrolase family protein [Bacillus mycoides]|uniref:amidohydrolase family protein n=1 Tax=Bacillus mycoides TaxID=1405 RepID=UPI000BF14074|nr:2-pyrone-4,6-dicarboxylate hydrolase [Bacillus mycoides]PEK93067.1 2-pyrone-4,6-dicarboxylate hydrolase [Bacillus mycoides]